MSYDPGQFKTSLNHILKTVAWFAHQPAMANVNAEILLLMTAAQESRLGTYFNQCGGPALGVFQIEPTTIDTIHSFIAAKYPRINDQLRTKLTVTEDVMFNFALQVAYARLNYWRFKEPIPPAEDLDGIASYYKKYWNTELGAATANQAKAAYLHFYHS